MKKTLKNIMAVGLAGAAFFGTFACAGCRNSYEKEVDGNNSSEKVLLEENFYVIVDGTLHKADLYGYAYRHFVGAAETAAFSDEGLDLYCNGKGTIDIISHREGFTAYGQDFKPDASKYEICEKCFVR